MPNQYSAADFMNVPRVYEDSDEEAVGNSFTVASIHNSGRFDGVQPASYPSAVGSYNAGIISPNVGGQIIPGSGLVGETAHKYVVAEGARINTVTHQYSSVAGDFAAGHLDPSGVSSSHAYNS